jgi:hypothetical protein
MNLPALAPISEEFEFMVDNAMGTLPEEAREAINARFQMIVRNTILGDAGQVVLFTTTLGEPPGSIIAVEAIDPMPRSPRRLQWAWGAGPIRI